jgi:hypothetical protein
VVIDGLPWELQALSDARRRIGLGELPEDLKALGLEKPFSRSCRLDDLDRGGHVAKSST